MADSTICTLSFRGPINKRVWTKGKILNFYLIHYTWRQVELKKRKVDSSLKRIKMNVGCQIRRRCVIIRLGGIIKFLNSLSKEVLQLREILPIAVSTEPRSFHNLCKTLLIGALSVDKLSIKHFTRGAIN